VLEAVERDRRGRHLDQLRDRQLVLARELRHVDDVLEHVGVDRALREREVGLHAVVELDDRRTADDHGTAEADREHQQRLAAGCPQIGRDGDDVLTASRASRPHFGGAISHRRSRSRPRPVNGPPAATWRHNAVTTDNSCVTLKMVKPSVALMSRKVAHRFGGLGVERGGRLVAQQDVGLAGERAGNGGALLLAPDNCAGWLVALSSSSTSTRQASTRAATSTFECRAWMRSGKATFSNTVAICSRLELLEDHPDSLTRFAQRGLVSCSVRLLSEAI
jgi:hypothetical protein